MRTQFDLFTSPNVEPSRFEVLDDPCVYLAGCRRFVPAHAVARRQQQGAGPRKAYREDSSPAKRRVA